MRAIDMAFDHFPGQDSINFGRSIGVLCREHIAPSTSYLLKRLDRPFMQAGMQRDFKHINAVVAGICIRCRFLTHLVFFYADGSGQVAGGH